MESQGRVRPRIPREFKDRAVRMVLETIEEEGTTYAIIPPIAKQLGISQRALRGWVRQAQVDEGLRPGVSRAESERLTALERENRELRRANEILKAASAFSPRGHKTGHRGASGARNAAVQGSSCNGCEELGAGGEHAAMVAKSVVLGQSGPIGPGASFRPAGRIATRRHPSRSARLLDRRVRPCRAGAPRPRSSPTGTRAASTG